MILQENGRFFHTRSFQWLPLALVGGIVLIFLGYLAVWINGPAAGLQFIGVEVGEWLKFLGVGPVRNIFYLPPFTLGSIIVLLSVDWSSRRIQSWLWRGVGVTAVLLSFPAYEDLLGSSQADYLPRIWMIVIVVGFAVTMTLCGFFSLPEQLTAFILLLAAILGLVGTFLPLWLFTEIRPTVSLIMGHQVGFGLGVWLNSVGHLLLTAVALSLLRRRANN